jgi:hypothetical protein
MLPVVADEKVGALTAVSMVALPDELLHHVVRQTYYSPLQPRLLVYLSSASRGLGASMQALLRQLKADHAAATALCSKMGLRSCKELREGKDILSHNRGLSAADLATLGKLGSVLPTLETLLLIESSAGAAGPDGAQRLAEGLGVGALPAVTILTIDGVHVGDAGASELAAALDRGALPRLKILALRTAAIGDNGLVALAPALRRLPELNKLILRGNPLGDVGLAALVAPPPAGAPPTMGGLTLLNLRHTQVSNAGCAALAAALDSGSLPALTSLCLLGIPASAAAQAASVGGRGAAVPQLVLWN